MVPMKNKRRNLQIDNKEQMVFMLVNFKLHQYKRPPFGVICTSVNILLSGFHSAS
jgi:hypothetical protein